MPCRETLNSLLKELFNQKKTLKEYLLTIKWIHVTCDTWTSCQNFNYLGVTIHFFSKVFEKNYINLALKHVTGEHTANNLSEELKDTFDDYDISDKIVSVTSDNAHNIQNSLDSLKKQGIILETGRCMGHLLQLIVKRVIDSLSSVKLLSTRTWNKTQSEKIQVYKNKILEIIEKSKGIVTSFSHSSQLCERLIEKQKEAYPKETPLKLIQGVNTRWHSLFMCLTCVKLLHSLISEIIKANQRKHKKIVPNLLCEEETIQ